MKVAGILGLIGGLIGLMIGILAILSSGTAAWMTGVSATTFLLQGLFLLVLAIVGIVGSALVDPRPKTAGVLMLIGGGCGIPVDWTWLFPGILLAIGGILALVVPKKQSD